MKNKKSIIKRTKELRAQGVSFPRIVSICESEGLLDYVPSPHTIRIWFYKAHPELKPINQRKPIKPEVKAIYIKQLKSMGFKDKELEAELKRLLN